MNDSLKQVVKGLREHLPDLDVRTEQCDVVRVYAGHLVIAVTHEQTGYRAKVVSLDAELDFESSTLTVLDSETVDGILAKVAAAIMGREQKKTGIASFTERT